MTKFHIIILILNLLMSSSNLACSGAENNTTNQNTKKQMAKYVINDFNFYPIPNITRPDKGKQFEDPTFHTKIIRITDAPTDSISGPKNYIQCGYPKHNIENADGKMLLIQGAGGSGWHIWNANPPYNMIQSIPPELIGWYSPIDARWDATDPDVLYYNYAGKFMKYSVSANKATVLHDFTKNFGSNCRPHLKEEGDSSADSRYWAFSIYCYDPNHAPDPYYDKAWVVYDKNYNGKDNGKIITTKTEGIYTAGFISMSPSGKYVWVGDDHKIYDRNLNLVKDVYKEFRTGYHADMAISDEGHEVLLGHAEKPLKGTWAVMVDLETFDITYLAPMPKNGGYHFSGNNYDKPGWGLVSSYYPQYPGVPSKWGDKEMYMVELTKRKNPPPQVWRLAHTHVVLKGYADAPFAKINKRGTKVFFGSGWGTIAFTTGSEYDVYQIDLPPTWYEDIKADILYKMPASKIPSNSNQK